MSIKGTAKKAFRKAFPKKQAKDYGWKDELREWVVSFVFAAVIYFIVLPLILGSSSPMVIVSSCSEKGYLDIGDILVVQSIGIEDIKAPLVTTDSISFLPLIDNVSNEVRSVDINGNVVSADDSNDIVVYYAFPSNAQIIHRALAKINVSNKYYLLTKGDANQLPDQMGVYNNQLVNCITENPNVCISTPVTQENLVGHTILFKVPLLGHLKLFFCDIMPFCDGHSNLGTNYEYRLSC